MNETIGIITARGGSKGVPRKNIKLLAGKPLIAWTIEAALQCKGLSRLIVSTDDGEIARIARQWGAEVPFIRPGEFARDDSSSMAVVLHAIGWLEEHEGFSPGSVMLLQPTSPFRTTEDMQKAIELGKENRAVVSVCEAKPHPYLCKRMMDDGTLADFLTRDIVCSRRQEMPLVYALNGAVYLCPGATLIQAKTFLPEGTIGYVMPEERSLDVDTLWDWHLAELIMREL